VFDHVDAYKSGSFSFPTRRSSDLLEASVRGHRGSDQGPRPYLPWTEARYAYGNPHEGKASPSQGREGRAKGPDQEVNRQCGRPRDRKSTRLNSSHVKISYAVCCLK